MSTKIKKERKWFLERIYSWQKCIEMRTEDLEYFINFDKAAAGLRGLTPILKEFLFHQKAPHV
jgi:hypothetical protein